MSHDPGRDVLEDMRGMDHALRDAPDEAFIARMRERFPTEREMDAMLTRKMRRRLLPRRSPVELAEFGGFLDRFLRAHVQGDFEVSELRWMTGGGSKIQLTFLLDWEDPQQQGQRTRTRLVVRMEPQESLSATSRLRESQLIQAFADTLPVPRVYWVDAEGAWFPEPALIYAFASGVTKPTQVEGRVGGVGASFGPMLRAQLGSQFVEHLARIHTLDVQGRDFSAFDVPAVGTTQTALWQLNRARRIWEEDRGEELPLMDVAANWLERHMPELDRVSVLHGDYRSGNFLFDEASSRITAWLDWERGYIGDRHRDLAWITLPLFGNYAEDGKTFLVSGLVPLETFYTEYERLSGLSIDPQRLRYYRILNSYQLVASSLGTAYRVARLGRSHQDVLLTWIEGIVYQLAEEMRGQLLGSS
ncbi:phosphotransferase family protein [Hydrogenophaga sp.]|uniref:phosphotransferase family protein n=1 Tax=Hydrogenophaga sp. TaxID=1904254 RepID=UPI00260EABEB|nr:phosphotransferase family protein [Hydrogenophaga sp.]MCW5653896.1 phosphotransferase family protein [Hydrogenophaga sp.]